MSSYGLIQAQIIERQREETRKQRVREQCSNMATLAASKLQGVAGNPQYSGLVANTSNMSKALDASLAMARTDPDRALSEIQSISEKVNDILSLALSREQQWSEDRRKAYINISKVTDEIRSIPVESKALKDEMKNLITQADMLQNTSMASLQLNSQAVKIKEKAHNIRERDEKETVRREIAKKIVTSLKTKGYIVDNPRIKEDVVFINAKTPASRAVMFQIRDDNKLKFDFDGYEGTTCKDELDSILEKVNSGDDMEMKVEQFVWHNPDKIKKGAKDMPYGQPRYMTSNKRG